MNFWEIIKKNINENREYFISILSFIFIIFLGVMAKIFLFYKTYFWYVFFVSILIFFMIYYFFLRKKEFKEFYKDAKNENSILYKKITQEKKDYFYLDKIIKVLSILLIIIFVFYFIYVNYK